MAASLLAAWMGKHCVPSYPMKSSTKQKGLWDSGPWNLCRLTQVRLIFIFGSAHQGSCFWRGWQLMWLMEPLLIGFVSPLCSRFRRSQCLPWRKSPMMPNRAEGICCQPLRHKVWAKFFFLAALRLCVCVFVCLCGHISWKFDPKLILSRKSAPTAEISIYSFSLRGRLIRYIAHLWFSCMYVFIQLFYYIHS